MTISIDANRHMINDSRIDKTRWDLFCLNLPRKDSSTRSSSNSLSISTWLLSCLSLPISSLINAIVFSNQHNEVRVVDDKTSSKPESTSSNMTSSPPIPSDHDDQRALSSNSSSDEYRSPDEPDVINDNLLFVVQVIISSTKTATSASFGYDASKSTTYCESRSTLLSSACHNGNSGTCHSH